MRQYGYLRVFWLCLSHLWVGGNTFSNKSPSVAGPVPSEPGSSINSQSNLPPLENVTMRLFALTFAGTACAQGTYLVCWLRYKTAKPVVECRSAKSQELPQHSLAKEWRQRSDCSSRGCVCDNPAAEQQGHPPGHVAGDWPNPWRVCKRCRAPFCPS